MPQLKEISLETPSSSGESDKFKEPCQRKKRKFLKHGLVNSSSQIPRASSAHRVETVKQPTGEKFKEPPKSLVPYRIRKSLSQMDLKQSRKNYTSYPRNAVQDRYTNIVLPKPVLVQTSRTTSKDMYYPTKERLFYMVNEPESGGVTAKAAGMKVFATIMLNAWRKRRNDVRRLTGELDQFHKRSIKVQNQIHVLNSVFRNEQKQNDKLGRQLRHASEEYNRIQSSVESLTTSLISAKAEASLFEQQLHAKEQENETLNYGLAETNSQLFKSMAQIRHLQTSLSCEQRSVQHLENQKNELLNEINLNEMKYKKTEEENLRRVYNKEQELLKANSEIKMLETLLLDLKEKEFQVRDLKKAEINFKNEIDSLKGDIKSLKAELDMCFGARMKRFWRNYVQLHRNTVMLIHLGAFYLLPAVPPPRSTKMPITLSLAKVMSIMRN